MTFDDPRTPRAIPETVAHRVLTRAAELDAAGGMSIELERLRAAAQEAGIAPDAFDAAWREVSAAAARESAVLADARTNPGVFHQLWRRLRYPDDPAMRLGLADRALTGATATAAALALWIALVQVADAFGAPWLFLPLSQFVAAGLAIRLRARGVGMLFAGLGVAIGAEAVMDAIAGMPTVRGAGAHWALMIAGVGGVVLGSFLGSRRMSPEFTLPAPAASPEAAEAASDAAEAPPTAFPIEQATQFAT
jgi:hypothetical protein